MNRETIVKRFELFLRSRSLKLTAQRRRIFDRAFGTHEHFSAERLEELQLEACRRKGFQLVHHDLRMHGYCRACARKRARKLAAARDRAE